VQLDAVLLFDELAHSSATPQEKVHLQLLGAFVDDGALDGGFLNSAEGAPGARAATTPCGTNGSSATRLEQVDADPNGGITQASHANNLHDAYAFLMQPHDLLSPLVKLFQCLLSSVLFVHERWSLHQRKSSYFFGPDQ
jgi:hypothetical protein